MPSLKIIFFFYAVREGKQSTVDVGGKVSRSYDGVENVFQYTLYTHIYKPILRAFAYMKLTLWCLYA